MKAEPIPLEYPYDVQILASISELMGSSMPFEEVITAAMRSTSAIVRAEGSSLLLISPEDGSLNFYIALGEKADRLKSVTLARGEGIAGFVAETGIPIVVPDVAQDPRFSKRVDQTTGFKTRSVACVPLRIRDELRGVIEVVSQRVGTFSQKDLDILTAIGGPIAIMIDNARLIHEVKSLPDQLAEAIAERKRVGEQIQASLREKEVLLKEIHHRVKNNMQVISSMLNLQAAFISDPRALEVFRESENRVRSIGLIHERFYQSKDLSRIVFGEYVYNLAANLFHSYGVRSGDIRLRINAENVFLNVDTAIPCGLIINEIISNSLKYAFPANGKGAIYVELRAANSKFVLIVGDDGIGLPQEVDIRNDKTFGLQLVATLIDQIAGTVEIDRVGGTTFKIEFTDVKYR